MNRTIIGVIAVMVVIGAIGTLVGEASKKEPPKSFLAGGSFRAVVVPTDRARTVVVTPCDAPSPKSGEGALSTPGVTTVRLQRDSGMRTVLVPRCAAQAGTQLQGWRTRRRRRSSSSPASARRSRRRPRRRACRRRSSVPSASEAETIVVPPCRAAAKAEKKAPSEVVLRPGESSGTAVAPAC